jgi:inorganic pyrophosphatase
LPVKFLLMRALFALAILGLASCADIAPPSSQTALPSAPAGLDQRLSTYFEAARAYESHVWRDLAPVNADGTINGYIEIPRGESTKWEFRIPSNRREVDRMIPRELGGYPVNYGFLPRTISYDGDPTDVLVLGPTIAGGEIAKGRIVGLMRMMDTGDLDSKVVISPLDDRQAPADALPAGERTRIAEFFNIYKKHEGKVTQVTGWGDSDEALQFLRTTAGFFDSAKRH